MKTSSTSLAWIASALLLACSAAPDDPTTRELTGSDEEPDAIGWNENPRAIVPNASSRLADNIAAADVGKTFGVPDDRVPYPDTYWPFTSDGIDDAWSGGRAGSPLEKYMNVVDPDHRADAKAWEHQHHGSGVPGVQGWYGHCPGWTAASMLTKPILHAVDAKSDGQGGVTACAAGTSGCVHFEIGDVNALAAEVYLDGDSAFIGARCDTKPSDIERDRYGRIARDGTGCHGLNAGTLLIVLGQKMKRLHEPVAIDAQNEWNTDQIWNQPAFRYTVYRYETLTTTEAANLVAYGERTGSLTRYPWNASARGFAFVDIGIQWVTERGPNRGVVSGLSSARETRFSAVIELNGSPSSRTSRIIGGEYLDDPSTGADRLTVPPFVWLARGPGAEEEPTSVGGDSHNPYVRPSVVSQLVALGTR